MNIPFLYNLFEGLLLLAMTLSAMGLVGDWPAGSEPHQRYTVVSGPIWTDLFPDIKFTFFNQNGL